MRRILTSRSVVLALPCAVGSAPGAEPRLSHPAGAVHLCGPRGRLLGAAPVHQPPGHGPARPRQCEETGRIQNFAWAGGLAEGVFRGRSASTTRTSSRCSKRCLLSWIVARPGSEVRTDEIIAKIAAAQEDDGYLYTAGTIEGYADEPSCCFQVAPAGRTSEAATSSTNLGHLYEGRRGSSTSHREADPARRGPPERRIS